MATIVTTIKENEYSVELGLPEREWLFKIADYFQCDDLTALGTVLSRGFGEISADIGPDDEPDAEGG